MTPERPDPISRPATPADAGRACPYCRFTLKQGAGVVECGGCHAPHHEDCWNDNGGCAVMGCVGAPPAAGSEDATVVHPPAAIQPPGAAAPPPMQAPPPQQGWAAPPPPPPSGGRTTWATPGLIAAILVLALAVGGGAVAIALSSGGSDNTTAGNGEEGGPVEGEPVDGTGDTAPDEETETTTEVANPDARPAGSLLPDESEDAMASEIQTVLLAHHEAIVAGNYKRAWNLTSPEYKKYKLSTDGYDTWASNQQTLGKDLQPGSLQVEVQELDDDTGVATVNLTGMGYTGSAGNCGGLWEGLTWARYTGGAWRYEPGYATVSERRSEWEPRKTELLGGCTF